MLTRGVRLDTNLYVTVDITNIINLNSFMKYNTHDGQLLLLNPKVCMFKNLVM